MTSKSTRLLLNVSAILGIGWIAFVIYGSFTGSGIWKVVKNLLMSDSGRYSPAGTFALSALLRLLPLAGLAYGVWWIFLRRRAE
jgi:hypothetical protein